MLLAERIKELRENKDISQAVLAEILNISQSSISEYENGNQQPPLAMIIQLADFFDVNVDYLLGHTNIKISMKKLTQALTTKSGIVTIDDFIRLKEDEKEAIGSLIKSFNKYELTSSPKIKKHK